jgi:hypothetical protein
MPLPTFDRAIVLALFATGVVLVLSGTVSAFVWRKADVTLGALFWAGSGGAAHPERYVRPDKVRVVRVLNLTGVGLFLLGVLVLLGAGVLRRG